MPRLFPEKGPIEILAEEETLHDPNCAAVLSSATEEAGPWNQEAALFREQHGPTKTDTERGLSQSSLSVEAKQENNT